MKIPGQSALDNPVAIHKRTGAYLFCEVGHPKRRQPAGQAVCPTCKNFAYKLARRNNTPLGESMRKASREYQRRTYKSKGGRVYTRGKLCKRGHPKSGPNLNSSGGCRICKRLTSKARRMGIRV